MQIFLRRIYGIWGLLCFAIPFLILLPFYHLFATKLKWHRYASLLNHWWAKLFFIGIFIPYEIIYRFKPQKGKQYVYCSNHTSMMDIITMGLIVKENHIFVGKESLTKVPLFGKMFAKLHIPVNRSSKISSYKALLKSMEAIENGKNIIIFPEGGIYGDHEPLMNPFKDGPFRIAIEKQVPIIPVTILYNWIILKDDDKFLPKWHKGKAIVHEAIETIGMTITDLEKLKKMTFDVIEKELRKNYPELYASNPTNITANSTS